MDYANALELAEIVGLSFGDGSLTRRKKGGHLRFQLRGNVTEDRGHYDEYVINLFNKNVSLPIINREVSVIECKSPICKSYGFAIQSNKLGNFLNSLGIPIGVKDELIIPEWIKSNQKFIACFLRGFFDTDGSIYCHRNYSLRNKSSYNQICIKLTTTSQKLGFELKNLLRNNLEIKCTLWTSRGKSPRKTAYNIQIGGGICVNRWFQIIGSKNPKHVTKYLIWKQFSFIPPYTCLEQRKAVLAGELSLGSCVRE